MHGGVGKIVAGKPLDPALTEENVEAVRRGAANLAKQIENVTMFGIPAVIAINAFPTDTEAEYEAIKDAALAAGARAAVVTRNFAEGGDGARELAQAVWDAASAEGSQYTELYPDTMPLRDKIKTIAQKIYRARDIACDGTVESRLAELQKGGFGHFPVCIAKTQYSFSTDPNLKGAPSDHVLAVREIRLSAGAEFIVAVCGEIMTMPGLPRVPAANSIDLTEDGRITGLF